MAGKAAGFTLIEAMVVVAIAAITLTLGVPAFGDVLQRQRVATTLHLLSADMAMARSTAVMRRARVVVCSRLASGACSDRRDWSDGWMVFADPDGNGRPDADADILRVTEAPGGDALHLPASRTSLRYLPNGRSTGANLSVHVCINEMHRGKIVVNNHGRIRSERPRGEAPCPYD